MELEKKVKGKKQAHTKFKDLLESIPEAIVITNSDKEIVLINSETEYLFKFNREELYGQKVELLIPDLFKLQENIEQFNYSAPQLLAKGGTELYGKFKAGNEFPAEVNWNIIKTEEETLIYITIRNISERKKIERELLQYAYIVEGSADAIITKDFEGIILSWNKGAENLFKYTAQEVLGKNISILIPQERLDEELCVLNKIKKGEHAEQYETIRKRKDGTFINISLTVSPLRDKNDKIVGASAIARDITERIIKNQKLKESETRFKAISNSSPLGIFVTDKQGDCIYTNEAYKRIAGDRKKVFDSWYNALKNNIVFETIFRYQKSDKSIAWASAKASEMMNDGELLGYLGIVEDISSGKAVEEKLKETHLQFEQLNKQLSYQNKQLEDFGYITSHNLRSPVSNLNALLSFYKEEKTERGKELIFEKFEVVIRNLTETLHQLLEAIKIKTDITRKEKLQFESIFFKVKNLLMRQIIETDTTVTADFSKAPEIEYPSSYLENIIHNLFTNAIKYRSMDRSPIIHFETNNINDEIQFIVADNGLGIDINREGSKLFGLHKTFHKNPDARGVGLFITKAQVEALGGEISIDSEVNKGTIVKIIFNKKYKNG